MSILELHPNVGSTVTEFLAREHQLFIDGKWLDAQSGKTFETFDPGTGQVIANVAEGDAADVDLAVGAARRALENGPWRRTTPSDRGKMVWRLADLLEQHIDELAELEALNSGKPLAGARFEIAASCDELRYMAGWATKITGETMNLSVPFDHHAFTLREPIGVVGQIIPWNGPLMMAAWKLGPALVTGCTIVLKPAEQTPLSALRLADLIQAAGIPNGVVNIVPGFGPTAGAAIAAHTDIDKVGFTGSTETGRRIAQAALGNFKRVTLELGGKSPVIVFPDADLSLAIPGAARAIFQNAGQVCSAGSRLYAHSSIFEELVDGVVREAGKIRLGHGLSEGTQMGPLVSRVQLDRVRSYIDQGRADGADVVTACSPFGDDGYFIAPTVLTGVKPEMSVAREEIFGPVLCAMNFDDEDLDRIAQEANATAYGLAASVWTRDLATAHKMVRRIRAGKVGVNTHGTLDPSMPNGGRKHSGWGREHGRDVLDLYTEVKSVTMSF